MAAVFPDNLFFTQYRQEPHCDPVFQWQQRLCHRGLPEAYLHVDLQDLH